MGKRIARRRGAKVGIERLEPRAMLATISGSVQRSVDASGLDPNDPLFAGIAGVTVQLRDQAGTLITQQVTNASGNYSFTGVTAGQRQVSVVLPTGLMGTSSQSLSYNLTVGTANVSGLTFALASRNQAIVQNLYQLVLQRSATDDEFTAAVGRLDAGQPVAQELGRLIQSAEFGSVVQPVAGFVDAMFPGVLPIEIVRVSGQQQRLGISPAATFEGIMSSQAFVATHGDTSALPNGGYVQFLYRQLLGRTPAPGPFRAAVNQLAAGKSRGQLALDLVNSAAFQARGNLAKQYRGAITYVGMLGREANPGEIRTFAAGDGNAVQLARQLSRSEEFRNLTGYTSTATWDVMGMATSLAPAVTPLSRLKQYNPQSKKFDTVVEAGSLTSTATNPKNVYFISHGWAPGQSEAVLLKSTPGNPLKSWNTDPAIPPWLFQPTTQVASAGMAQSIVDADPNAIVVAFSWIDLSATPQPADLPQVSVTLPATGQPATGSTPQALTVTDTSQLSAGMSVKGSGVQEGTTVVSITSPTQVVISKPLTQAITSAPLAFAGADLESTIKALLYVGQSESRTQWAGLMLAQAIREALAPDFFGANKGLVHIMGHSHGAKVATVATVALEAADVPVSQLTLFDSPETGPSAPIPLDIPGIGGGQNFVWRFLQELPPGTISKTPVAIGRQATGGTFVDNYYSNSGFGAPINGFSGLGSVVDVMLRPDSLYNPLGASDMAGALGALFPSHSYPPAWYAQASLQNPFSPDSVKNGLYWSPLVSPATTAGVQPSYEQFRPVLPNPGEFVRRQFEVTGGPVSPTVDVTSFPLAYAVQPTMGSVTNTDSSMTFNIGAASQLSMATVSFVPYTSDPTDSPVGTGLELDVAFSGVDSDETVQLVVSVHGMAILQLNLSDPPLLPTGSTGFMTIPLLTLDGGVSGAGPRMATVSLDVFRNQTFIDGAFGTAANPVPQLVFSLIGSAGATASATVTNIRQFGTPT